MSKGRARLGAHAIVLALAALGLSPQLASGDPPEDEKSWAKEALRAAIPAPAPSADAPAVAGSDYSIIVPTPLPPGVTVAAFTNRSGVEGLDWLGPAAAFIAGELLQGHSGLRTEFGSLIVHQTVPLAGPAEIAEYATKRGAKFVVTGSYSRPNWELELRVELWEVEKNTATRAGLAVNRGEFKLIHEFLGRSFDALLPRVGLEIAAADVDRVRRVPTADFYAFTLFGRGLSGFLTAKTQRDYLDARKNLERAVFIDPSFVEGQRVLGEFYRALGKTRFRNPREKLNDLAKTRFERALAARPDYAAAQVAVAAAEEGGDRAEVARDLYADVVRARPYDFEARFRLGKILWDLGQAEDSFVVLEELVAHRPNDIRARRILVMIHSARGSGNELVSELEKVSKLDPSDEQTRMDLGAAYAAVSRQKEAIEIYEEVVAANPRRVAALKFLGDLYKKGGQRALAIKYYGMALAVAPTDPRAYFTLGALYVEAGEDDNARRIYQRAMRFKRYAPELHTNLGAIAFRTGNLEEALAHHEKAVALDPRRARFRYNLALALSSDGQLDAADAEIALGLRYESNHVGLNYQKGVVLLRRGDIEAAQIQFEKTMELDPENEDALHNLTLIEELRRRAEEGELIRERRN